MPEVKNFQDETEAGNYDTGFAYCPKCQIMDGASIPLQKSKYGYSCKVCDTTYMTEEGSQLALEDAISSVSYA